jgi:D-mannonate dehydratase
MAKNMRQTNTKNKHSPKKDSESAAILGIAWYKREEWSHLSEIAADRDEIEDTYEEWLNNAETRLREMAEAGINAKRVYINVGDLQDWCIVQRRLVDGSARAVFTAEKLRQLHEGQKKGRMNRWSEELTSMPRGGLISKLVP